MPKTVKLVTVEVITENHWHGGKLIPKGERITIGEDTADQMIAAGRAKDKQPATKEK